MPTIKKGDLSLKPIPGWVVDEDGEGLLTSRVVFKGSRAALGSKPKQNDPHPFVSNLLCYKSSSQSDGQTATVSCDYVGIAAGTTTGIRWSSDTSSSVQPIQAHPNFTKATWSDKPLRDYGWDDDKGLFPDGDLQAGTAGLLGVRSFLAPEQTVSGFFYTSDKSWLQKWLDGVGCTIEALPGDKAAVVTSNFKAASSNHDRKSLLASVSYEQYAHIYKVNFTVRIATGGWNKLVYNRAPTS
jgi:hypothetical protein